jgi:hypothetical protein
VLPEALSGGPLKVPDEQVGIALQFCRADFDRIKVAIGALATAKRDMDVETGHRDPLSRCEPYFR